MKSDFCILNSAFSLTPVVKRNITRPCEGRVLGSIPGWGIWTLGLDGEAAGCNPVSNRFDSCQRLCGVYSDSVCWFTFSVHSNAPDAKRKHDSRIFRCSSGVEQPAEDGWVVGSIPTAGTFSDRVHDVKVACHLAMVDVRVRLPLDAF